MRIGVIGCGAVAQQGHLPAIKRCRDLTLGAVVDSDARWAAHVARAYGAEAALHDYRDVIGRVDVAIVATPNWTHADIVGDLLRHGIHVLCEKPLALSSSEAADLFALAERCSVRLMPGHSRRFTDGALALRKLLQIAALGSIEDAWGSLGMAIDQWPARQSFRTDARLAGGGCLIDSGIHVLDMFLWLMGTDARVERYEASQGGAGYEEDAALTLRFPNDVRARVACSYSHALGGMLEIRGSHGWARLPLNGPGSLEFAGDTVVGRAAGVQRVAPSGRTAYENQLCHFVACIRQAEPFLVHTDEVLAGLRIIEECYAPVVA